MICPKCNRTFEADATVCAYDGALLVSGTAGSPSGSSGGLSPGMMVGDYQIEHKLGEGGMGEVYRAVQPLIGKRVAIKVLKSTHRESVGRFVREARAVTRISHRNIVDIFNFGQLGDGRPYFVMEYLDGIGLDALLKERGALPPIEALAVLRQVARALEAAHARNIAHRDLKPANIFLVRDDDGVPRLVKLLDFGIAKPLLDEGDLSDITTAMHTRPGSVMGTPHYMAPECFGGGPVDPIRVDLYALGVVTYQLFTGVPPYTGRGLGDLVAGILLTTPLPPSRCSSAVPVAVDGVVLKAMSRDPAQRFARAGELVDALEAALSMSPPAGGAAGAGSAMAQREVVGAAATSMDATLAERDVAWCTPAPVEGAGASLEATLAERARSSDVSGRASPTDAASLIDAASLTDAASPADAASSADAASPTEMPDIDAPTRRKDGATPPPVVAPKSRDTRGGTKRWWHATAIAALVILSAAIWRQKDGNAPARDSGSVVPAAADPGVFNGGPAAGPFPSATDRAPTLAGSSRQATAPTGQPGRTPAQIASTSQTAPPTDASLAAPPAAGPSREEPPPARPAATARPASGSVAGGSSSHTNEASSQSNRARDAEHQASNELNRAPDRTAATPVAKRSTAPLRVGNLEVGRKLPRIAGLTLDGASAVSLDMLLGRPGTRGAVVQLWASWCAPCLSELSQVAGARDRLEKAGVQVLLVNLLEEPDVVEKVIAQRHLAGFSLILDANGVILEKLGLRDAGDKPMTLPISVVTDRDGVVTAILTEAGERYVDRVLQAI